MIFNGHNVVIDRSGAVSFIIHGLTGLATYSIHEIQSVRLHRARGRTRGFLQLRLAQQGWTVRGGVTDENSVIFTAVQQPDFERMTKLLRRAIREVSKPIVVNGAGEFGAPAHLRPVHDIEFVAGREVAAFSAANGGDGVSGDRAAKPRWSQPGDRASEPPKQTTAEARAAFVENWASAQPRPAR